MLLLKQVCINQKNFNIELQEGMDSIQCSADCDCTRVVIADMLAIDNSNTIHALLSAALDCQKE